MTQPEWSLIREFREAWLNACTGRVDRVPAAMSQLLTATGARAVGWWKREADELRLLCFDAIAEMPDDVRTGFADATGRVAMSRMELGCVRAAAEQRPVVAREDAAQRGLTGSASWLERFGASQSLALPIVVGGRAVGVLAIATAETFAESSAIWRLMVAIVEGLAADHVTESLLPVCAPPHVD
jgi:GAF domain-containing protein